MQVDVARSAQLHAPAGRARCAQGNLPRAAALNRARRRVDDRFDPAKALAGTARYLKLAKQRFGREDLAFVSYHMGMGNLENVLKAFGGGRRSYAELYFDSTPLRHEGRLREARVASATTPPTTSGSSARRWRSCGSRATTRTGWCGSPRCRRPTTPRARCCWTARRRAICARCPTTPPTPSLSTAADVQLRPEALGAALYAAAQVRDDLRRAGAAA